MFFNIGGYELLVIAMVALIAVGPEQLPVVLRKMGRFLAQARAVTANLRDEFMSGLDEVKEVADPESWMGSGTDDDPIVPRGFAAGQRANGTNGATDTAADDGESDGQALAESEAEAGSDASADDGGEGGSEADADSDVDPDAPPVNQIAKANAMRAPELADDDGPEAADGAADRTEGTNG